jgi:hypothetical protein
MNRIVTSILAGSVLVGVLAFAADGPPAARRQIPIIVTAKVDSDAIREGEAIPLTITVSNGLPARIYHNTFSLTPTDWNGETMGISLVDIYRDRPFNLYLARPEIRCPNNVSGMGRQAIESGDTLSVRTDARKWTLRDGWKSGHYTLTIRVDNLTADDYSKVSVMSDPVEFVIK